MFEVLLTSSIIIHSMEGGKFVKTKAFLKDSNSYKLHSTLSFSTTCMHT